jgi:two-component system nitrate/nitrite response regulator NarL
MLAAGATPGPPARRGEPVMPTRVLVVAGVRLYRDGLTQLLDAQGGIQVVGTAATGKAALARMAESRPEVVLLEMELSDAAETIHAVACLEAGAAGYVDRDASLDELLERLESAARGEMRCSPTVAASLARRLATVVDGASDERQQAQLTRRESEIVALIELGLSNKQIARRLFIEVSTVKNHVHHILEKLNVSRRGEAAARARRGSLGRQEAGAVRD